MSQDCKDGEFILTGTKWNKLYISKNKGGSGLQELNLLTWLCWLRALTFGVQKSFYFITSKFILFIILFHFIMYPTFQFLFLHRTH